MTTCTRPEHTADWPGCRDCAREQVDPTYTPPSQSRTNGGTPAAAEFAATLGLAPYTAPLTDGDLLATAAGNDTSATPANPEPTPDAEDGPHLPNLPDKFWEARPILGTIRIAAHRVGRSADAVLGCVLARVAAMTSHELLFDFSLGEGTLNLYCALVGWPAAGKSKASDRATDLLVVPQPLTDPDKFKDGIGLGSGEGLAEVFMGTVERETGQVHTRKTRDANAGDPKTERIRTQVRHNVYIYVDEGEKLTKQLERQGATAGATIRTGWSGGTLGEANATEERNRSIPRWNYSLGMVIGYQPKTVRPLLDDVGPGTPQRFLFLSAHDPNIPTEPPDDDVDVEPVTLAITDDNGQLQRGVMAADPEIRRMVWDWNNGPARGAYRLADLDGHILVMHCKLSALFAILDGRRRVAVEDWDLAAMLWETSCGVRDALVEWTHADNRGEQERRTAAYVEREERAQLARTQVDRTVLRVAAWMARKVHAEGPVDRYVLKKKAAGRDIKFWVAAEDHAAAQGWISLDADRIVRPGQSRPA